jgi:hypothetical protein
MNECIAVLEKRNLFALMKRLKENRSKKHEKVFDKANLEMCYEQVWLFRQIGRRLMENYPFIQNFAHNLRSEK